MLICHQRKHLPPPYLYENYEFEDKYPFDHLGLAGAFLLQMPLGKGLELADISVDVARVAHVELAALMILLNLRSFMGKR